MDSNLTDLIAKARALAAAGDDQGALSTALELANNFPAEVRVWSFLAHLHEGRGEYSAAVSDLTRAIVLEPMEPIHFLERGSYHLLLADARAALADFDRGIELCDHYKSDYYRATLLFLRADVLIGLGRKHEALVDLRIVPDGFTWWTDKLLTKTDLVAECLRLPG